MIPLPCTLVFQMARGLKPIAVKKIKYAPTGGTPKRYQLSIFNFTKAHVAKVGRIGDDAAMYIGPVQTGRETIDLHAKSMSIKELQKIIVANPYVGLLAVDRGENDTGGRKMSATGAIAFKDEALIDKAKLAILRQVTALKHPADTQKNKMYAWEHAFRITAHRKIPLWKRLTLGKLTKISQRVIKHFKLPNDRIHVTNSSTRSASKLGVCQTYYDDPASETISFVLLNIHDSSLDTLLHELAHMVCGFKFKRHEIRAHGAEFVGVYAHLLGLFADFDEEIVIKSMLKAGLKVKPYKVATTDIEKLEID